jgi:MFS transporter, NNP family, nitrate/nitrite transporter
MIPAIFAAKGQTEVGSGGEVSMATFLSTRRAGALMGLAGAVGAFGGVLVNLAFWQSYLTSKSGDGAVMAFIAFYAVCCLVTWAMFLRRHEGRLEGD